MIREDEKSSTRSEVVSKIESQGSTYDRSSSDELLSDDLEKSHDQTEKAKRSIENRMRFFKNHLNFLCFENGKVVDSFHPELLSQIDEQNAKNMPKTREWLSHVTSTHSMGEKREESNSKQGDLSFSRHSSQSLGSVLDQVMRSRESEKVDRKTKQFYNIKMKRIMALEKLSEYLEKLEKKQQQRLFEEHTSLPRKFHYAGPSRNGPLFCLREKYRRERKAWRIKYAKKYGLLCSKVRLEKRLMRKANRLLLKKQVLTALKDKTQSKLMVLHEMKQEFKKLLDKVKLKKDNQEKIKREIRCLRSKFRKPPSVHYKVSNMKKSEPPKSKSIFHSPGLENTNLLKLPQVSLHSEKAIKRISALPPLPLAPSSSTTVAATKKQLNPKSTSRDKFKLTLKNRISSSNTRFFKDRHPVLNQDKNSRVAKVHSTSACLSGKDLSSTSSVKRPLLLTTSKAVVAKNSQQIIPLLNETKLMAAPTDEGHNIHKKSAKCDQLNMFIKKYEVDSLPLNKYKHHDDEKYMNLFVNLYKKLFHRELEETFGNRCHSATEIKVMCDYVLDYLKSVPLAEVDELLDDLMKLKYDINYDVDSHESSRFSYEDYRENLLQKRDLLIDKNKILTDWLKEEYTSFEDGLVKKKKDHSLGRLRRLHLKRQSTIKELKIKKKKKRRRTLADKLLLQRGPEFKNPVRVTTKLGGRLMLQGWRQVTYQERDNFGMKLTINKGGWRKDGLENYEVIIPLDPKDNLYYQLVLNRLDLTPRRFILPEYNFNPHAYEMMQYCSKFYRNILQKKGDRLADSGKCKSRIAFQPSGALSTTFRLDGEYTVPHLRHRIFSEPEYLTKTRKPKDRNTPMMFSKCEEISDCEDNEPKKIRILLLETETLDLLTYESRIANCKSDEGIKYIKDMKRREQLNKRFHRYFDKETQTEQLNFIDRATQLFAPARDSKKTNVFEMEIKIGVVPETPKLKILRLPGMQQDDSSDESSESSMSSVESVSNDYRNILTSREFASKLKQTLRIMDSLVHSEKQLAFRKGLMMDPLDPRAEISYSHERLFSFVDKRLALSEFTVTSMDWSSVNPNLLGVGYSRHPLYPEQDKGLVCIWNVKSISKYERKFDFISGVTYIQFCVPFPRLLNVALMDGSVLILDLGDRKNGVFTTKLGSVFSDYKPVWQFSWYEIERGYYVPLTCGDNGIIHQLRPDGTFQHSKFLSLGHREGKVKGIQLNASMGLKPRMKGRPGITCLTAHPKNHVIYLVGTSDGCVHICSVHFRNQHSDVFSAHVGAVKGIEFHPHCEHVFLTFGEDFFVRVWLYGTFEPALELMADHYYVRSAKWSPANPEILISLSQKFVNIWDIRRKTDSPLHRFKNQRNLENTSLIFDASGNNIVVGNIGGDVNVYALKNFPFTHHFKEEAIANALEKVLKGKKKFENYIKKLGYPFGLKKEHH